MRTVDDYPRHLVSRMDGPDGWFNQLEHVLEPLDGGRARLRGDGVRRATPKVPCDTPNSWRHRNPLGARNFSPRGEVSASPRRALGRALAGRQAQAMAAPGVAPRLRRNCGEASSRSWAARSAATAVSSCSGGRVNGTRR